MIGVKQMLSLIWSRESAVKEEVVQAYKRLYIEVRTNFDKMHCLIYLYSKISLPSNYFFKAELCFYHKIQIVSYIDCP